MTPPLEDLARAYFLETPAQLGDYLWERSCLRKKLEINDGRAEPTQDCEAAGVRSLSGLDPGSAEGAAPRLCRLPAPPHGDGPRRRQVPHAPPPQGKAGGRAPLTALTRSIKAPSEDTARRAAYRGVPRRTAAHRPTRGAWHRRSGPRRGAQPPGAPARPPARSLTHCQTPTGVRRQPPKPRLLTSWLRRRPAERGRSPRQDALSAAIQSCRRPGGRLCTPKQWRARARWLVPPRRHSPPGPRHLSNEGAAPGPGPRDWMVRKHSNSIGSGSAGTGRRRPVIGPGGRCPQLGGATGREGAPGSAPASGGRSTSPRRGSTPGEPRCTARPGGKERPVRKAQPEGQQVSGMGAGV